MKPRAPKPPAGQSAGAALDTSTDNVSRKYLERRRKRKKLRRIAREFSTSARLSKCGYQAVAEVQVVRSESGICHYTGLLSCGLLWICPVCAGKIRAERAREVELALTAHIGGGYIAAIQTFTVSHDVGDDLETLRRLVTDAFRAILAGHRWSAIAQRYGRKVGRRDRTGRRAGQLREAWELGTIRALEVTHGRNGWHPHIHVLFFFDREISEGELQQFGRENCEVWRRIARAREGKTVLERLCPIERVRDATPAELAKYLTKFSLELTRADLKVGGTAKQRAHRGRSPFEVLEAIEHAEGADRRRELLLWQSWERGIKGARAITWSRGLKKRFAVAERSDEAIAEAEIGGELLLRLTVQQWHAVRDRAGAEVELLEVAERGGGESARLFVAAIERANPKPRGRRQSRET